MPEWIREWCQWSGTQHSQKLQHYWNVTIRFAGGGGGGGLSRQLGRSRCILQLQPTAQFCSLFSFVSCILLSFFSLSSFPLFIPFLRLFFLSFFSFLLVHSNCLFVMSLISFFCHLFPLLARSFLHILFVSFSSPRSLMTHTPVWYNHHYSYCNILHILTTPTMMLPQYNSFFAYLLRLPASKLHVNQCQIIL